jgi:hypothetical protein
VGDSTYQWTISFPPGVSVPRCIAYGISGTTCGHATAAQFEISAAYVLDSNGAVDTLQVVHGAVLLPEGTAPYAPHVDRVDVQSADESQSVDIVVEGAQFRGDARVSLQAEAQVFEADNVLVTDSEHLTAHVVLQQSAAESYDLNIRNPGLAATSASGFVSLPSTATAGTICLKACRPTNAAFGFTQIPLHGCVGGCGQADSVGHDEWPTSLANANLVAPLASGDSILIGSYPHRSFHGGGVGLDHSFGISYDLPTPIFTNQIGILSTGGLIFNGSGIWADAGKTLLGVNAIYSDGSVGGKNLKVGEDIRDWADGYIFADNTQTNTYTAKPTSALTRELFAGLGSDGQTTVYYDLQQIPLPDSLRNKKVTSLLISTGEIAHGQYFGTAEINGLALWPSFEIQNRQGGSLGLQSQRDPAWKSKAYGGFVLRDTLFGAFKTIGAKGCMLSCMAMAASYFGDPVSPKELDEYLARHEGFQRNPIVRIATIAGQDPGETLTYTDVGKASDPPATAVDDTILFEARNAVGWSNPVATAVVGPSHGHARIIRRHGRGILSPNEEGYGYVSLLTGTVTDVFSNGRWFLRELGTSATRTPAAAESALVDSVPVLLNVCGAPVHFVLANGWKPIVGANSAHGTYVIRNPGHSGVSRLSDSHFNNTFDRARRCQRVNSPGGFRAAATSGGLTIVVSGGAHASITDPSGRALYYDADREDYVGDLEGAIAWPRYDSVLDDDPDAGSPTSDMLELPGSPDGDYRIVIMAPEAGSYAFTARINADNGVAPQAVGGFNTSMRATYGFNLHVENGATPLIRVDTLGTASVTSGAPIADNLKVRPNPTAGSLEVEFGVDSPGFVSVEVFDVTGRRVGKVFEGVATEGRHSVSWNPRAVAPGKLRAGIYLVRVVTSRSTLVKRVAVMD